jgi:hypothetical protein
MHMLLVAIIAAGVGMAFGAIGHAMIAKEEAATKAELAGWGKRLRTAVVSGATSTIVEAQKIIAEIDAKL